MAETNPSFLSGVPELLILRLIAEREMYGYELVQAIRERSGAVLGFGEGVIYPVLHTLEKGGALSASRKSVNGRSRVYYTLTPAGSQRLGALTGTWTRLTQAVQTILAGAPHAEPV